MYWYTINYALGSVLSFLFGLFVLYRGEARGPTRKAWFFLCVFISLWHTGHFLMQIAPSELFAQMAVYPIYVGAILIPPCYLHFILSLLDEERKHRSLLIVCYVVGVVELILLVGGWLIAGVTYDPHGVFYEVPTRIYWLYVATYVVVPSIALGKLILVFYRTEVVVRRNQFKYVIYSSLIGFLGGATSFFPFVTSLVPPIGAPVVYFYALPITYAVARYRLMDINVVIKKSLIYAFLLLGFLIPCYLLVVLGQKIAFGTIHYTFSITTLVFLIIVGFSFPKLQEALERASFKGRYDYRETLLRSSRDMISIVDLETLSNNLLHTVEKALGVDKASLFLLDDVKGSFDLKTSIGFQPDRSKPSVLTRDDPLIQKLVTALEPLVREEIEMARDGPGQKGIADRMALLEAEVSLPLVSKDRLIGVLNMGHKQGRDLYSGEDLEVLATLANQAAIAIENARLYENLRQSQDIIRRADRLSSLGMLTAGLAHEIRNPLVAIRTFTQLLPERYADAEFRNNFQKVALKEVDRICGLVNDLLSFARPSTPNVSAEDVNQIVESTARILETAAKENDVRIDLHLDPSLPNILIDKEQIKQVLVNFVLNAIQAIEDGGVIELSTRSFAKDRSQQFVQVGVRDSGVGIPVRDLENIFNPFFTTKEGGSGLGLSISHQIVQDHGGSIIVESKESEGSTFLINLPVSRPLKY
jgi:two-component system NtrC family sensor kinase